MLFIEATVGANIFHSVSIKAKLSSHLIDWKSGLFGLTCPVTYSAYNNVYPFTKGVLLESETTN